MEEKSKISKKTERLGVAAIAAFATVATVTSNHFFPIDPALYEVKPDPFRDAPKEVQDIHIVNESIKGYIAVYHEGRCFLANAPQRNGYILGDEASYIHVPCDDKHMRQVQDNNDLLAKYGLSPKP